MKVKIRNRKFARLLLMCYLVTLLVGNAMSVFATGTSATYGKYSLNPTEVEALSSEELTTLITDFSSKVKAVNTKYGSTDGSSNILSLVTENNVPISISMNTTKFSTLTSDGQSEVINALSETLLYQNYLSEEGSDDLVGAVTTYTTDNSVLMDTLFSQTKPDFVSATKFLRPFNSPIGFILGLAVYGLSLGLVATFVMDIGYMTIPAFRGSIADSHEQGKKHVPISFAALNAVKVGEQDNNGTHKQVLWIYLKDRVLMVLLFALCLSYLVNGAIFSIVGAFLDLVQGAFIK